MAESNEDHHGENIDVASENYNAGSLPPLPEPNYTVKRRQEGGGTCCTLAACIVMAALTHGVALTLIGNLPHGLWWTFVGLIYSEILLAVLALLGLLSFDPGTIKRSQETCFPLPSEVQEALDSELDLPGNNIKSDSGDVFCVRCLVWRRAIDEPSPESHGPISFCCPAFRESHHCSMCQRCVERFDHHCGFFGRCISKRNYKLFVTIIVMGVVAYITCLASIVMSLAWNYDGWVPAVTAIGILLVTIQCFNRTRRMFCCSYVYRIGSAISDCFHCRRWNVCRTRR